MTARAPPLNRSSGPHGRSSSIRSNNLHHGRARGGRRLVSIVSPPERQKALKSIQRRHSRIEGPRQCVLSSSRFKTVREIVRGFEIDLSEYLKADLTRDAGETLDTAGSDKHKRPLWSNSSRILTQYELWISVLQRRFNTIKRILETNRLNSAPRALRSRWYSWNSCTTSRVGGVRKPKNRTVYHSHLPRTACISVKRKPLLCHRKSTAIPACLAPGRSAWIHRGKRIRPRKNSLVRLIRRAVSAYIRAGPRTG